MEGGIRLTPYARLIIEPLFAYNHFEDEDEEGSFGSYGSDDDGDDGEEVKKKNSGKPKKAGKSMLHVTNIKIDIPIGGNLDEVTEKIKKDFEEAGKKFLELPAKKKPKKEPSSSSSDDSEDEEPDYLGQMIAFLGESPEDQTAAL